MRKKFIIITPVTHINIFEAITHYLAAINVYIRIQLQTRLGDCVTCKLKQLRRRNYYCQTVFILKMTAKCCQTFYYNHSTSLCLYCFCTRERLIDITHNKGIQHLTTTMTQQLRCTLIMVIITSIYIYFFFNISNFSLNMS